MAPLTIIAAVDCFNANFYVTGFGRHGQKMFHYYRQLVGVYQG
jgi:hypothetical protein